MEVCELKKEIINTGYLDNVKIGMIFNRKYPTLVEMINHYTSSLDNSLYINKFLRARVIFLIKYDLDLSKIKNEIGWLTFDRKKDDFIDKTGNHTKKSWDKIKNINVLDLYTKEIVIKKLKNNNYYLNFLGKSKNRTMMKEDLKLFKSIYYHTDFMDRFNKNNNKFSMRILFLVNYNGDNNSIKCNNCNENYTSFNYEKNDFNKVCKNCFFKTSSHYPTKKYFQIKYGKKWETYYKKDRKKVSLIKVNSKEWFIKKYGELEGMKKYSQLLDKKIENIKNLKHKKYSKISQKLFWLIYDKLTNDEKEKCFFKELNHEILLKVSNDKYFFPDFVLNKKIIEYDGVYWHKKDKDKERNLSYKKIGYDVLSITEKDFNRQKINHSVVDNCLKFIRNET